MVEIIKPGNGASGNPVALPPKDPFQMLGGAIMQLAAAKNKQETMARLANCQRHVAGIRAAFMQLAADSGRLMNTLKHETKGEIYAIRLEAKSGATKLGFEDSEGTPIAVVDPAQGLILIRPQHVLPIMVRYSYPDKDDEVHEVPLVDQEQWEALNKPEARTDV